MKVRSFDHAHTSNLRQRLLSQFYLTAAPVVGAFDPREDGDPQVFAGCTGASGSGRSSDAGKRSFP